MNLVEKICKNLVKKYEDFWKKLDFPRSYQEIQEAAGFCTKMQDLVRISESFTLGTPTLTLNLASCLTSTSFIHREFQHKDSVCQNFQDPTNCQVF